MSKKERLQKVIAASGYTSRRKAEHLILEKRVKVNDEIVDTLGSKVYKDDLIKIDNKLIKEEAKVYYVINKPANVLSSVSDDRNRRVVVDLIADKRRIYPVGRLDYDTTGLLMLTNDGDFTNAMTHPSFEISKTYEVLVDQFINDTIKFKIENGLELDGTKTALAKLFIHDYNQEKNQTQLKLILKEGRNRQVKRMFETVGVKVLKLHRSHFAFVDLKGLKIGEYRKLSDFEVEKLLKLAKLGENDEK